MAIDVGTEGKAVHGFCRDDHDTRHLQLVRNHVEPHMPTARGKVENVQ